MNLWPIAGETLPARGGVLALLLAMIMTAVPTAAVSTRVGLVSDAPVSTYTCYPLNDFFGVSRGPVVVGDVTGDRQPDTVSTRVRWVTQRTCRAWLVVAAERETYRMRIDPVPGVLIGPPPVAALVKLGHQNGLAIAVTTWKGASTGFVDLYAIRGHRLRHLNTRLFGYAGSLVNLAGVDCASEHGAVLVSSTATYRLNDDRYHVRRTFYALRSSALEPLPPLTEVYRVRPTRLERFPELFFQAPFPSCMRSPGLY
jgi:hypothetical protein